MNKYQLKAQKLIALFLVGCLLFTYPVLSLASDEGMLWGIPVLYIYIFAAWAAVVGLMVWIIEYYR